MKSKIYIIIVKHQSEENMPMIAATSKKELLDKHVEFIKNEWGELIDATDCGPIPVGISNEDLVELFYESSVEVDGLWWCYFEYELEFELSMTIKE